MRKLGRGRRDSVTWDAKLKYWAKHLPRSETGVYVSPSSLCLYRIERGRKSYKPTRIVLSLTNISISKGGEAKLITYPEKLHTLSSVLQKQMDEQINKQKKSKCHRSKFVPHTACVSYLGYHTIRIDND